MNGRYSVAALHTSSRAFASIDTRSGLRSTQRELGTLVLSVHGRQHLALTRLSLFGHPLRFLMYKPSVLLKLFGVLYASAYLLFMQIPTSGALLDY